MRASSDELYRLAFDAERNLYAAARNGDAAAELYWSAEFDRLDALADTLAEPCPGCGTPRGRCIATIRASNGRACCPHCAEAPLGDTHRGPRPADTLTRQETSR